MSLLIKPQPLATEFDRLFGRMFDAPLTQSWVPAMDLTEAEDHYLLKADLPGCLLYTSPSPRDRS